jgi:hypothetical protein
MSNFDQWNELLSLIVRGARLAAIFWWGYKTGETAGVEKARDSRSKQDKELLSEARPAPCVLRGKKLTIRERLRTTSTTIWERSSQSFAILPKSELFWFTNVCSCLEPGLSFWRGRISLARIASGEAAPEIPTGSMASWGFPGRASPGPVFQQRARENFRPARASEWLRSR